MKNNWKIVKSIIYLTIIVTLLAVFYKVYTKNNFNDYIRAEYHSGYSKFERDSSVKCSNIDSYKIENTDYNDAMFYKTVKVTPNTPYKVTCKIKTQNVKSKEKNSDSGAHICIADTVEKSDNITGTTDWTQVEFYFNSKNREEVGIGFRLGGYEDNSLRNSMVFRF